MSESLLHFKTAKEKSLVYAFLFCIFLLENTGLETVLRGPLLKLSFCHNNERISDCTPTMYVNLILTNVKYCHF